MDASRRVPSPNLADFETVLFAHEPEVSDQTFLVPRSEIDIIAEISVTKSDFGGDCPRSASTEAHTEDLLPKSVPMVGESHKSAATDERDSEIQRLKHIVTEPDAAVTPASDAPLHAIDSSKEKTSFSVRFVAICALSLIVGIAVGLLWSWRPTLTSSTAASGRLVTTQLNAITQELSSLRRDLKDLAARQQRVAEAQDQLAATQARLVTAQEQETVKDRVQHTRQNRSRTHRP